MPSISHKYLEKMHKEVGDLENWLGTTQPQEGDSANPEDLKTLYQKAYAIYQKSLALHQTTVEPVGGDELNELRQDVVKFDHWLLNEIGSQPGPDELQLIFTRANAITLKALSLFRNASQNDSEPQETAGDEHTSLSST